MQFALIVYETDADAAARSNPATVQQHMAPWFAYSKALAEAGIARGGAGLQTHADATTVKLRDGKRQVHDGPFADTKERLGGFFVIEVPNLDKALEWAARCPAAASGSVEVRPLLPPPPTA
jgi:hypothetical protein